MTSTSQRSRARDLFGSAPALTDWMTRGSCAGADPELFFPKAGEAGIAAKRLCAGCPVAAECLTYALLHPDLIGVWGRTTFHDRRMLHQQIRTTA